MGVTTSTANAGATYVPIVTYTLPSSSASYTFTSIPTTYTDLILVVTAGSNQTAEIGLFQVGNGSVDTGSNYSVTYLLGNGSAASSGRFSNQTYGAWDRNLGITTNTGAMMGIIHFMNYSNTTTYKTIIGRDNQTDATYNGAEATVNLWRSTSAINTIKMMMTGSAQYNAGTTFTLYGIKAA